MSEPQRLHPAAILEFFIHNIYGLLKAALPLLIVFIAGNSFKWLLLAAPFLLSLFVLYGILYWFRYVFYVSEQELRLEYGIFKRKKRYIPFERIQTVQTSAGILQRMFGLVKLQVETAGGGSEAEFVLPALSREKADALRQILQVGNRILENHTETDASIKYSLSTRSLLLLASTSNGIGVVLSALLVVVSQLDDIFSDLDIWNKIAGFAEHLVAGKLSLIVLFVIALLLVAWLFSLLGTILKFGNFHLVREGNNIKISRGLLEKQQLTIPIKRIQAITVVEGLLRQPFGMVSIQVVSISNTGEKGEGSVLFPLLPKQKIVPFLQEVVPEFAMSLQLQGLPARSRTRYLLINIIPALVIAISCTFLLPWGYLSFILLLLAAWLGNSQFKDAGWETEHDKLLLRCRRLDRITTIIPHRRIQSLDVSQNILQKRISVNSLGVAVASGGAGTYVSLKGIEDEKNDLIINWFD
ncbi:MAG: PH domain-containing protein [Bacillota bacterium]|nr:PH domain-containing protein [Bacillota bacterium]